MQSDRGHLRGYEHMPGSGNLRAFGDLLGYAHMSRTGDLRRHAVMRADPDMRWDRGDLRRLLHLRSGRLRHHDLRLHLPR